MKNKGMRQYRFKQNPMEKIFAKAWEERNTDPSGRVDGRGTLDYLLTENPDKPCGEVSDRDRIVAATVIQWLGSPVGQYFLYELDKKQKEI